MTKGPGVLLFDLGGVLDESAANVRAAQCIGMRAPQVDGFAAVRDALEAEGIVPA